MLLKVFLILFLVFINFNNQDLELITKIKNNSNLTQIAGYKQEQSIYLVTRVVDGDTIVVEDKNGRQEKIRLIGIDTPETKHPRKSVECFGQEATKIVKKLLLGKKVYLQADSSQANRDKYNRLLRYVFRQNDNLFINRWLVSNGYAYEYTYNLPYQYQEEFKQAELKARQLKRGLWSDETCSGHR